MKIRCVPKIASLMLKIYFHFCAWSSTRSIVIYAVIISFDVYFGMAGAFLFHILFPDPQQNSRLSAASKVTHNSVRVSYDASFGNLGRNFVIFRISTRFGPSSPTKHNTHSNLMKFWPRPRELRPGSVAWVELQVTFKLIQHRNSLFQNRRRRFTIFLNLSTSF